MKIFYPIWIAAFCSMFAIACQEQKAGLESKGLKLVWADEFDIEGLPDTSKWSYDVGTGCDLPCGCGWGNNELQFYTKARRKNARVAEGHLVIEAHHETFEGRDFTSARLVTKGKGDWKYGRIDIKAKIPYGLGVWSAIWMLPTENQYGIWPRSGEIDIMENVGFDPDTIVGSAHTLAYHHAIGTHKSGKHYLPEAQEAFHVYTLDWNEDRYTLSIDGTEFFEYKNDHTGFESWPYDQRFHLILNIAFGGNWGGREGLNPASLPAKMLIDYVRVYQ